MGSEGGSSGNRQARPELCKNVSKALRFEDAVGDVGIVNPRAKMEKQATKSDSGVPKNNKEGKVKEGGSDEGKKAPKNNDKRRS